MPSISWERDALSTLLELARTDYSQANRIIAAVYRLKETPRGAIKLQGYRDRWRIRVGDWRVVFVRSGAEIVIIQVVLRRDAYGTN